MYFYDWTCNGSEELFTLCDHGDVMSNKHQSATYRDSIVVTCKPEMCEADAFYYTHDCTYDADNEDCCHG